MIHPTVQEEISYEIAYMTEGEWRDYGRTRSLEAAQEVVEGMREQTNFQEWEIRRVTIRVETMELSEVVE